jgi:CheY-like chemotaxis protein
MRRMTGLGETMTADEKVNILMVDDQPAKLLSYEVILGDLGENLIKATSAKEALNILLKNDIAVVLMDVSMPELDGFELADSARRPSSLSPAFTSPTPTRSTATAVAPWTISPFPSSLKFCAPRSVSSWSCIARRTSCSV